MNIYIYHKNDKYIVESYTNDKFKMTITKDRLLKWLEKFDFIIESKSQIIYDNRYIFRLKNKN